MKTLIIQIPIEVPDSPYCEIMSIEDSIYEPEYRCEYRDYAGCSIYGMLYQTQDGGKIYYVKDAVCLKIWEKT